MIKKKRRNRILFKPRESLVSRLSSSQLSFYQHACCLAVMLWAEKAETGIRDESVVQNKLHESSV